MLSGNVSSGPVAQLEMRLLPSFLFYFLNQLAYFWLCWVFVAVCRLSLVAASRAYSSFGAQASHCSGFFCCGARALGHTGFSSCGSWA